MPHPLSVFVAIVTEGMCAWDLQMVRVSRIRQQAGDVDMRVEKVAIWYGRGVVGKGAGYGPNVDMDRMLGSWIW